MLVRIKKHDTISGAIELLGAYDISDLQYSHTAEAHYVGSNDHRFIDEFLDGVGVQTLYIDEKVMDIIDDFIFTNYSDIIIPITF